MPNTSTKNGKQQNQFEKDMERAKKRIKQKKEEKEKEWIEEEINTKVVYIKGLEPDWYQWFSAEWDKTRFLVLEHIKKEKLVEAYREERRRRSKSGSSVTKENPPIQE